jgi:ABC-2 type transport system ATP-binding protein
MLKVEHITKSFADKKVLSDISFQVDKGQIVALLGENGAGKSTLLRILSAFFEADSGSVSLDDLSISNQRTSYLRHIGYVQEISALYGDMNVHDFLFFEANIRNIPSSDIADRVKDVVTKLQLREVLGQETETLSKGFKKRTELAAVLLAEPDILFLDEPTEGLDPNQKTVIRKIIKQYAKKHIVIISTHTLEDVEALADRILLLHKGELLFDDCLTEFKKKSHNDLSASFRKATAK